MSRKKKQKQLNRPRVHVPRQSVRRMEWFIDDAPVVGKKCKICDETFYYNLDTEIFCPTCKKTLKKLIIQNIE